MYIHGNLEGKIKDLRVEMADMDRRLSGEMAALDGKIDEVRVEMAGVKVFVVWMVVGVITVLGVWATVLSFVS